MAQESWSIPRTLGHYHESPGTAGRHCEPSDTGQFAWERCQHRGHSDTGLIRPGQLVDPAGPRTRARVTQNCWSTPWNLRYEPESPGRAGRPCQPADMIATCLGELVDPAGPRNQSRFAWDNRSTPLGLVHGPVYPGTTGPHRGPLDTSVIRPGLLVDIEGPRTRTRVAHGRWLTLRALGHGPESPGTAG